MRMIVLLPCLCVTLLPVRMLAQQTMPAQSLSYSGVMLNLRDAEQPTLDRLKKSFQVQPLKSDSPDVTDYLVTKNQSAEIVGVITFRRGVLVKAYRDWTPVEPSAYSIVLAIKGAVDALRRDGLSCALEGGSVQEPNYSNQGSYIVCGLKSVEITGIQSSQLKGGTSVSVYEWLTDPSEK